MKDKYKNYYNALRVCCIDSLVKRREKLILAYGRKLLLLEQTKELFPQNENTGTLKLRTRDKYILLKQTLNILRILQYLIFRK